METFDPRSNSGIQGNPRVKFKNPAHIPAIPKSWRGTLPNGEAFKIPWPNSIPYGSFYQQVVKFHTDNGMAIPSSADVENAMCQQMPAHWCVGNEVFIAPAPAVKPCAGCGRRW